MCMWVDVTVYIRNFNFVYLHIFVRDNFIESESEKTIFSFILAIKSEYASWLISSKIKNNKLVYESLS